MMKVKRFDSNPIIYPGLDERMGSNINGPSLIRVPDWVLNPLGKYYLYFAHHHGSYIRLAYADELQGPWQVYEQGVLDLADSHFDDHVASPDVQVVEASREIRMYYHGCYTGQVDDQKTRVAVSGDGLQFSANEPELGSSYWRVFYWQDYWYTLEMPGQFRRSRDGITNFEPGPLLFHPDMRHAAVLLRGDQLLVCYTIAHDRPEHIVWQTIDLAADWWQWQTGDAKTLLKPEFDWEGVDCPIEPSQRGAVHQPVHQLRDPCLFVERDRSYLVYAVAGENGLAIAELFFDAE